MIYRPDQGKDLILQSVCLGERKTAVPVLMELKRIIINEIHDQQYILLHEVDGSLEHAVPGQGRAALFGRVRLGYHVGAPILTSLRCSG